MPAYSSAISLGLVAACLPLMSCSSKSAEEASKGTAAVSQADYRDEIQNWRLDRVTRLKDEAGWLTLVGLFWISDGISHVGSDPAAEVPLPASAPKQVGTISLRDGKAHFSPASGVALKEIDLRPDSVENYDVMTLGPVRFYLIERGGRYGIRVKDSNSPARVHFTEIPAYPVDATWRIEGTFTPSPHKVTFDTEAGVKEEDESPGYVDFMRDGKPYRLEPVTEDNQLFFVIRDATSGKTTYAASRFVYADIPKGGLMAGSKIVLDFNKAYNPPCVFTDYATCPLPTQQNRMMAMAITAGEKIYKR